MKNLRDVLPEIRIQTYFRHCLSEDPVGRTGQFPSSNSKAAKSTRSRISHIFFSFQGYDCSILSVKCCNIPKIPELKKKTMRNADINLGTALGNQQADKATTLKPHFGSPDT